MLKLLSLPWTVFIWIRNPYMKCMTQNKTKRWYLFSFYWYTTGFFKTIQAVLAIKSVLIEEVLIVVIPPISVYFKIHSCMCLFTLLIWIKKHLFIMTTFVLLHDVYCFLLTILPQTHGVKIRVASEWVEYDENTTMTVKYEVLLNWHAIA